MHPFAVTVVVCLAIVALALLLMQRGWSSRQRRQVQLARPTEVPQRYDDLEVSDLIEGTYVCTTISGDWLDRVAVHTLGVKSQARILFYDDAVIVERTGARDLWIPSHDLREATLGSGMNGKFVEKNGLLIITWDLHGQTVDTGFRTQYAEDNERALERLQVLIQQ